MVIFVLNMFWLVHNTTQGPALCCASVAAHRNVRIDSDPVLVLLCFAFLRLVTKNYEFMNIFVLCKLTMHMPLCHIVNRPLELSTCHLQCLLTRVHAHARNIYEKGRESGEA